MSLNFFKFVESKYSTKSCLKMHRGSCFMYQIPYYVQFLVFDPEIRQFGVTIADGGGECSFFSKSFC